MPNTCNSCGYEIDGNSRKGVPSFIDCCKRCWSHVSVADRLKLSIACRDRSPGGVFGELTEVLINTIDSQLRSREEESL